jgi:signal transduction histidine kinase
VKKAIRNFIIGKDVYIASRNDFKQVMLSGQYALVSLFAIVFYLALEVSGELTWPFIAYAFSVALVSLSLVMHRRGRHCLANCFLFPTVNILLYLVVSSESKATGSFLFFFPLAIGSTAVFNYSRRRVGFFFMSLSLLLLWLSISDLLTLMPYRSYSLEVIQVSLIRNVTIAFVLSVTVVSILISLNHRITQQLECSYKQTKNLNTELDRFVYSTSHDLRAPLLSVKGLVALIKTAKPNEQLKYLELVDSRIDSLNKFIADINDYSRNNRLEIVREDINISDLAADIWESLRYSPEARGIKFENEIPTDLNVVNDGRRMRVVLMNLISNAVRYHDRSKANKYIRLYSQATDSSFSLHIEDNGIGIAPQLHDKIFEMFFRGNEMSQGSGLGLYIVKETLSKLSGRVQLKSVPSQGSTFIVTFQKNLN